MDELTICWSITTVCNYKCSYCFSLYDSACKQYHMEDNLIDYTLDRLEQKSKENSIRLVLLGGEPTLCPSLDRIVNRALYFCRSVIVVTNGSQLDTIKRLNKNVSIDLSYHGQDLSEFINRIENIQKTHYLQVLCVLDPNCLDRCIELSKYCSSHNIFFEPIPLVHNDTEIAEEYEDSIFDKIDSNILYNVPNIGILDSVSIYKLCKHTEHYSKLSVCKQKNIAIYADGSTYPCCKTGFLKYKTHIKDPSALKYQIICEQPYCLYNRGCLDMSGWRQDPNGFLPWNNE